MKFFISYPLISKIIPSIGNENDFQLISSSLLMKPTILDYEIAPRTAKTIDTNKEHTRDNS
jgi:hypothetical protein